MRKLDMSSAPRFGRAEGLTRSLVILHNVRKEDVAPVIVEIGCIRGGGHPDMIGDGWSTLAFSWYCAEHGGNLYAIDRDEKAIAICKELTAEYFDYITFICEDSIVGLKQIDETIDLLYLDGHAKPQYSYNEYMEVKDRLSDKAIILIDDVDLKGKLVVPQLTEDGWNNLGKIGPQQLFVGRR